MKLANTDKYENNLFDNTYVYENYIKLTITKIIER